MDISQDRVDALNSRRSPIIDAELSQYLVEKNLNLSASIDLNGSLNGADYVVVSTPTNYDERRFKGYVLHNFKVDEDKLNFSYCGIRPKIKKSGKIMDDFIIHKSNKYHIVHMIGIDSPGLTSSLAIAEYVAEII